MSVKHLLVYKMLTTYLNSLPFTKFVLIEDCVTAKATKFLEYLLQKHERRTDYRTHYFIFGASFTGAKRLNSVCHDFTTDVRKWLNVNSDDLKTVVANINDNCVIVVDSLAHVLYRYGLVATYQLFAEIKNVQQVVAVLHTDLLEDKHKILQYFEHLATLHLQVQNTRICYTYKKTRKIIKRIEDYRFDDGQLVTEVIKKPDQQVIEKVIIKQNPAQMTTFKIELNEAEKQFRDNLVLPYLPKDAEGPSANIHYTLDEVDDWDEEDPDDDLDI